MCALARSLTHGVDALRHASEHLDLGVADRAVQALLACSGRRYFTGIGKSGHAAARMASSLSSIGLAAHWVHGAEWSHGELGALGAGDLVFAVSHSGSTQGAPRDSSSRAEPEPDPGPEPYANPHPVPDADPHPDHRP